jgi:hypothetical protein
MTTATKKRKGWWNNCLQCDKPIWSVPSKKRKFCGRKCFGKACREFETPLEKAIDRRRRAKEYYQKNREIILKKRRLKKHNELYF